MPSAKKYHDANEALYAAQQSNQPPPDLGDVVTRHQRALADFKRLGEIGRKLSAIDKEVTSKQAALKPFEYGDSLRDAMLRQEMRQHMRGMTEDAPLQPAGTFLYEGVAAERDRTGTMTTAMSAIGPKRTLVSALAR